MLAAKFGNNPIPVKVIHQRNGGQLSAFVTGLEQATGDLVLMLDADDTYAPTHVANVVRAFDAHPEVDFIFTAHRQFGEASAVVPGERPTTRPWAFRWSARWLARCGSGR